jgi:hypothetical protein
MPHSTGASAGPATFGFAGSDMPRRLAQLFPGTSLPHTIPFAPTASTALPVPQMPYSGQSARYWSLQPLPSLCTTMPCPVACTLPTA